MVQSSICRTFCLIEGKGHGSGCTTTLMGMHGSLFRVYGQTPPTSLYSDNTQNLEKWNVFKSSACIQDLRSMCWQHITNFDLQQQAVKQFQTTKTVPHPRSKCQCICITSQYGRKIQVYTINRYIIKSTYNIMKECRLGTLVASDNIRAPYVTVKSHLF